MPGVGLIIKAELGVMLNTAIDNRLCSFNMRDWNSVYKECNAYNRLQRKEATTSTAQIDFMTYFWCETRPITREENFSFFFRSSCSSYSSLPTAHFYECDRLVLFLPVLAAANSKCDGLDKSTWRYFAYGLLYGPTVFSWVPQQQHEAQVLHNSSVRTYWLESF